MIPEGTKVVIKPEAWKREFPNELYSGYPVQAVYEIGDVPPFEGMYMLTYPFHWWYEDDLELAILNSPSKSNIEFVDDDEELIEFVNDYEELAAEAARWIGSDRDPSGRVDAPEAVSRQEESVSISMRLPKAMLSILREFARREGVGYQVLMKRWLDERIREEAKQINDNVAKI